MSIVERPSKRRGIRYKVQIKVAGFRYFCATFASREAAEQWEAETFAALQRERDRVRIPAVRRVLPPSPLEARQRKQSANAYVLPLSNLRALRREVPLSSGVYILFSGNDPVYVGCTTHGLARIHQHRRDKAFDTYVFIGVPPERLEDVEALYIRKLKPSLNKTRGVGDLIRKRGRRR